MHISLTEELDTYVRDKISGGTYGNASELIREALRMMINAEQATTLYDDWVRAKVDIALAEIDRGEERPFQIQSVIDRLNTENESSDG